MNHYDRLARLDQERQRVQEAARRLLAGTARVRSGTPTATSLARESGINRSARRTRPRAHRARRRNDPRS